MNTLKAFVARDKDGMLFLYLKKPVKMSEQWSHFYNLDFLILDDRLFPEVKWEDEEATELTFTIKK